MMSGLSLHILKETFGGCETSTIIADFLRCFEFNNAVGWLVEVIITSASFVSKLVVISKFPSNLFTNARILFSLLMSYP